jgi:hypothetical protein
MLQRLKNTLQIPFLPEMKGSSPLWLQIDETLKPASLRQYPVFPASRLAWQFLGQIVQSSNSSRDINNS